MQQLEVRQKDNNSVCKEVSERDMDEAVNCKIVKDMIDMKSAVDRQNGENEAQAED